MAEQSPNDEAFWEAVVSIAADDSRLVSAVGSILLNMPTAEDTDYGDMQEYLHHRYGLPSHECINQAFSLCEQRSLGLKP